MSTRRLLIGALLFALIAWGAALLHGGIYELRPAGDRRVWRINRFTGQVESCVSIGSAAYNVECWPAN